MILSIIIFASIILLFIQVLQIRNIVIYKFRIKFVNSVHNYIQKLIDYRYDSLKFLIEQSKDNVNDYNKLIIMDDYRKTFIGKSFKGVSYFFDRIPSYNKMIFMFHKWTYDSFMNKYEKEVEKYYIETCCEIKEFMISSGVNNAPDFELVTK